MKLKASQVEFIERDLEKRGVAYDPLREDLVDHICCEVEEKMEAGKTFMDAYQEVALRFVRRGLVELNTETTSILSLMTMTKNFLTTAIRIFQKSWTYSVIRIFGLSLGISVFLLAVLYFIGENKYDDFHPDAENIYRMGRLTDHGKVATTTFPLVPTLREDYPQYRFTHFFKDRSKSLFRKEDKLFYESNMIFADVEFLQFFHFKGFKGNPASALRDPFSVVLTEDVSRKYFGRIPELGEVLDFKWGEEYYPVKITGLIPEWPSDMHIQFDVLIAFETTKTIFPGGIINAWNMNYCYSYVKLPSGVPSAQFESSFEDFVKQRVPDEGKAFTAYLGFLQPLTLIHVQPEVLSGYTEVTDPNYPKLALAIGFLVLFITSINFVTLTIAQFHERSKEVGIRKAVGASRRQVILQFIFETFILVTVSFLLGICALYFFIGLFNQFMPAQLSFSIASLGWMLWSVPVFILLLTLVTGLYPAIFFSAQNIMDTIHLKKRHSGISLRKILLTTQYVIAATLITFCIIIYNQVDYVQHKSVGYTTDHILYIPHGRDIRDNPEVFKTMAMKTPAIESVSLSFYKPTDNVGHAIDVRVGGNEPVKVAATSVDDDFFGTFGIDFVHGGNFQNSGMDITKVFILNEAAVKFLELDDPLAATLETEFQTGSPSLPVEQRTGKVIGVVRDVHFESLHTAIKPMIFMVKPYWYFYINVRINGHQVPAALAHLESTWRELFPDLPFEYTFLDSEFEQLYQKEKRLAGGLGAMAILALVTTCLGLFGYMRFVAQQKTKEVGIRKVLGATLFQISSLFSKEFIIAIGMANLISIPVSYYVSTQWLQNFTYRIDFTVLPYIITLVLLGVISTVTVLRELIRVMHIDPSATLRYD